MMGVSHTVFLLCGCCVISSISAWYER